MILILLLLVMSWMTATTAATSTAVAGVIDDVVLAVLGVLPASENMDGVNDAADPGIAALVQLLAAFPAAAAVHNPEAAQLIVEVVPLLEDPGKLEFESRHVRLGPESLRL
jgi:hypothetical protein